MKTRWLLSLACLFPLALAAGAQDQVVICPRGNPDECYAPDDPRAAAQVAPDPANAGAPGALADPSLIPSPPGQAYLEWREGVREPDPLLRVPGMCARSAGRARDRFEQAIHANDLNALVATYQWRGKDDASAEPLIHRLSLLALDGGWESSFVSGAVGDGDSDKIPTYWRWAGTSGTQSFAMKNIEGCWFVEFSGPAPDVVPLPSRPLIERLPQEDLPPSTLPDMLVF